MKFPIASLLAVAASVNASSPSSSQSKNDAKTKYVSNLLGNATTIRKLNQEDYTVDISSYFVKFSKCQFVRGFDDDLAANEASSTVLGTTRFVIFRLCPNSCSDSCTSGYGEYLIELDNYLQLTVAYFQEVETEKCNTCYANCNANDNANRRQLSSSSSIRDRRFLQDYDCSCVDSCDKMQNMEANGVVDATNFLQCKEIYGSADETIIYYAAPICTYEGTKINIGVFTDEKCEVYDADKRVEDYFAADANGNQATLSHALLKMTYQDTCISCLEEANADDNNNNAQDGDAADGDSVAEICENLYNLAGKCEYAHGFENGYYGVAGYENQNKNEDIICAYIKTLQAGTYEESGEIHITGAYLSVGGRATTTTGQKIALSVFIIGTVGLAVYAAVLHSKLTKGPVPNMQPGSGTLA